MLVICRKGLLKAVSSGRVADIVPMLPPSLLVQPKVTGASAGDIEPVPAPILVHAGSGRAMEGASPGLVDCTIAGGMENMDRTPYLTPSAARTQAGTPRAW